MIQYTREDHVALLTLDRPQARNAISMTGWEAMAQAVADIAASDARAVILRSATPGIFSAGADIGEFETLRADPGARTRFRLAMRKVMEPLAALPMPVIAAIDGGCYGAAVALVLACDLRIAGGAAEFAVTPAKLGIGYPREDVARLAAQVGKGQAARMLYTCEIIDGIDAERIGLVELRADEALSLARAFADRIAANAPGAVRLLKRTLADPSQRARDDDFEASFGGEEFGEGLTAFRERRRPSY
ncbi:enoyl-CoA hydratase/isomerase family protein [Stakelama tenebrarum]|uniref:Enoyl-CoA hydratase/isomerase family protein n=1 Tax=Stakelama tenebrarum TaxID=2711215 RepID=A0A6G6Y602_9SPHN|nr:enoyl-CoA hydratase/isomerase family protein [Sphingosinithalassobacter tenebrarum]QIG80340.1 enoyl-CoA hydratase/isomerase family protein [Sphingosinithalassobacter tenebrarum]